MYVSPPTAEFQKSEDWERVEGKSGVVMIDRYGHGVRLAWYTSQWAHLQ